MNGQKTILAVAIGDTPSDAKDISADPPPAGVRPYINGLLKGLPGIGTVYKVDYYERPFSGPSLDDLFTAYPNPDVVFCMSVRVVERARSHYSKTQPIVAVVSDYASYKKTNVTGFSAERVFAAVRGYDNFWITAPDLTAVYVLHHQGHPASQAALAKIQNNYPTKRKAPNIVHVEENHDNITKRLDDAKIPRTAGVFILPIDRCFGDREEIIAWQNANHVPTFWPVTDWVDKSTAGAFGGYGVPQEHCGERMGAKVATIWGPPPTPPPWPWEDSTPADRKWIASSETAAALGLRLGSDGTTDPDGVILKII